MRKPTRMEWTLATAAALLVATCAFVSIMAKIMVNVFFVMYSDVRHPWITEIFLAGNRWSFIVPLVPGIPALLSWSKGRLERDGYLIITIMHIISVGVLMMVGIGIMMPLLTTTLGLSGK